MPATKFTITGGAAEVAGVANLITITADDVGYVGAHNITFSGANPAPDTTAPTTTDNLLAAIAFGGVCALTFAAGIATSSMILYAAEVVDIACTDGTISAAGADRLNVVVTEAALDHFALVITTGQVSTRPFTGTNDITAQDQFDNPITTFDASADNVVISPNGGFAAGAITGLGSGGLATLDQAGDFTNGVANFTSALVFTIAAGATDTFTGTSTIGAKTGVSNAFGLSAKFVITGGAAQVAGAVNTITITADNASYAGSHVLVFSGANSPPLTAGPKTRNSTGTYIDFGLGCDLTFAAGVATSDMVLTKAETVDIACTDGFISAAGADRLNVVVTAGVAVVFDYNTDNGATVVAGVQFQILDLRAIDGYGNIDLTYDFPGGKNITFEAAPFINPAPDGTQPTVTDRLAAVINFGAATSLVFNLGQAVADGIQLKVKLYDAELAQLIRLTDGTLTSVLAEGGGFLTPKEVDVLAAALDHFVLVLGASQQYTVPFIGTNTLTAQDQFDNVKLTFDASADNVTLAENVPLVGTVSGLGSLANDTLDQAGDFVLGVADLAGLIVFSGSGGQGTFTATSVTAKTGTSGNVGFNLSSQGLPILIEGAMALSYQNGGSAPNGLAIYPRVIKWDNPAAAGHKVTITDINGKVLFTHTAQAQYKGCYVRLNRNSGPGGSGVRWKDFIVTQIDSGELFIWYTT